MRIVYPYNEILPKKRAHDVYIFQECVALAKHFDVHLLCGKGSQDETSLYQHYKCHPSSSFHLHSLPIVRKNNLLNLSWNFPFFYSAQKKIHALKPDMVFLSVLKQAEFHLRHKLPKTRYFYEVHQLQWYPGMVANQKMVQEKKILQKADVVITTTQELANILKSPPYCLSNPIEVVPLAVDAQFIPKRTPFSHILTYCGQLYRGQGIDLLLEALAKTTDWKLHIIGGKPDEIAYYEKMAKDLNIDKRASFLGFHPPKNLAQLIQDADAFVAPFEATERMPYVAHTKLLEYALWGRPIVAPDLPVVREHFPQNKGVLLFQPGNSDSLATQLEHLKLPIHYSSLFHQITSSSLHFSWDSRIKKYISIINNFN